MFTVWVVFLPTALEGSQLRFSSQFCDVKNLPNCSTKLGKLVKITALFSLKNICKVGMLAIMHERV